MLTIIIITCKINFILINLQIYMYIHENFEGNYIY